jgi:sulfotransferase
MFFNSSMPRAGSELLQVILHQNPMIYASPTSPLLEYQFAARQNFNLPEVQAQPQQLMESAFLSMCQGMAVSYYSAITDRPFIIDKNRGWLHYYEWVAQWNPNPKMICMVRDLRSIIASMEKVFRKNRHLPTGPDNPSQMQNLTVHERAQHWLSTQPIGLALQRTYDAFQRGVGSQVLFVRYEDLIQQPEQTMLQVYQYLELDPFVHAFDRIEKTVAENDKVFGPYGSHQIKPTLATDSNWKNVLDDAVGDYIVNQHRWYFNTFYKGL